MSRCTNSYILLRCFHIYVIALLLVVVFSLIPGKTSQAAKTKEQTDLLQFTAAGHILGFEAEGIYVAAGDHMLRIDFAGASGVAPVADGVPSSDGQAQQLVRITYPYLWPGVTLRYDRMDKGIIQSNYLLEPGADVDQIQLCYNSPVEIEAGGNLRIRYETGQMRESAPIAWQYINGHRTSVEIAFCLIDSSTCNTAVGFALSQYNPAYPLMIDPTLEWNTFMGSSGFDHGSAIAVDGNGNVYVTGYSDESWGSPVNAHEGNNDAFAAKLNNSGVRQWNTFMGSSGSDRGHDIAVDVDGNVYVTGYSDATWGSPVNAHAGGMFDVFVVKVNKNGMSQWNTFLGSSGTDEGSGIAVDTNGNVYVTGNSGGSWGSPLTAHAGSSDAFAAMLNSSGISQWNTFLGSSDYDGGAGIAVDTNGNVYVTGYSYASWASPVNPHSGGRDVLAAKINSNGFRQWHTFMGSSGSDSGSAIAVDGNGNVYVTGDSDATWGSPVNAHEGNSDTFVAKLNSNGDRQWNTFMGSSDDDTNDTTSDIAIDGTGNIYVVGSNRASWGSPLTAHAGSSDAFSAMLNSSGVLQWNTFLGSSSRDSGSGIAVDGNGNVYVAGTSFDTWGLPINAHAGSFYNAFAAKLDPLNPPNPPNPLDPLEAMPWIPLLLLDN